MARKVIRSIVFHHWEETMILTRSVVTSQAENDMSRGAPNPSWQEPQANLDDHAAANQRLNQAEDDAASSKRRPKPRHEGNSEKLPNDMPSLIILPPRPVAALSPREVQRLIEEKVAKAIQATE
ncbi:hypothetical protein CDL15_Pgr011922 [Punica granatum]|uniref:Uncharacterized protein n=1 Tax=Punica granatum TaxID=22663 RepID=A0A218WCR8_PUNGR|nr:hypothetical protein CDL15_Pgr011922 [Punica granatum]